MKELNFKTAEMAESDFLLLETERTFITRGTLTLSSVNKFLKVSILFAPLYTTFSNGLKGKGELNCSQLTHFPKIIWKC